jgi:hypothetical protein
VAAKRKGYAQGGQVGSKYDLDQGDSALDAQRAAIARNRNKDAGNQPEGYPAPSGVGKAKGGKVRKVVRRGR